MDKISIDNIKKLVKSKKIRWSNHVLVRLLQRDIAQSEVENALLCGEIIEEYESDYPYPSCLVYGVDYKNKVLHVVCGVSQIELCIITAYYPDHVEWKKDLKTRKEKK